MNNSKISGSFIFPQNKNFCLIPTCKQKIKYSCNLKKWLEILQCRTHTFNYLPISSVLEAQKNLQKAIIKQVLK